jgi:hypothetical protein
LPPPDAPPVGEPPEGLQVPLPVGPLGFQSALATGVVDVQTLLAVTDLIDVTQLEALKSTALPPQEACGVPQPHDVQPRLSTMLSK